MATTRKALSPKKSNAPAPKSPATPPASASLPVEIPVTPAQLQLRAFETAVRHFSAGQFTMALTAFQHVARGPAFDVAQRARSYIQVCERRLSAPALEFRTADDHYTYAVERLNALDLKKAREHLQRALQLQPRGEHILYTLGICCGLAGDGTAAYENLKLAFELDPRTRFHARQDSDFAVAAERCTSLRTLLES